jgi:hypothetical protein
MALRDIGADYECVGWSEIDKWAIKAHDAVFPELAGNSIVKAPMMGIFENMLRYGLCE